MIATFADQVADAVAAVDFGKPVARKRGRTPGRPYVPVVVHPSERYGTSDEQILGRAYSSAAEAVSVAQSTIDTRRARLATQLAEPRHRALREQHGLPRELPE